MFATIEKTLIAFREKFTRELTFQWFVVLVIGFMIRSDHLGVTSVIRDLALLGSNYESLLHFFYSSAWVLEDIRNCWYQVVNNSDLLTKVNERILVAGDGVKESKEAFFMPGVKKLAQESENSAKPDFIHGHLFGAIGAIIGSGASQRCIPLCLNIQDGLEATASWDGGDHRLQYSHVIQMIQRVHKCAKIMGKMYLILDRYFLTVPALIVNSNLNHLHSKECNLVEIITKAKSNCVAYSDPPPRSPGKAGRNRKKGDRVKLSSLFSDSSLFTKVMVDMYGDIREVEYYCIDLLWGNRLYRKLRFVLTKYNGMQSILVSTDLTLSPTKVIEIYAKRDKIERFFRVFKQEIGGFAYHFWTTCLPKLNHFKKKGEADPLLSVSDEKSRKKILMKIRAIEMFVLIGVIATGIMQMFALSDDHSIKDFRYKRTVSRLCISEGDVRYYMGHTIFALLLKHPSSFVTRFIRSRQGAPLGDNNSA